MPAVQHSAPADSGGGAGLGVPLPAVEGTIGQVLAIASLDPLTTEWVDAGVTIDNTVLTEGGDYLVTEGGDYLSLEAA